MILTSNRGFSEWGDVFGGTVVASAVNQTVRLPRWRRAVSYSAQFVTRRVGRGM